MTTPRRSLSAAALTTALLVATGADGQSVSIGINFLNLAGDSNSFQSVENGIFHDNPDNFLASAVAGAPGFAQANWNQFRSDWGGQDVNDASHAGLVTSTGSPVTNLGVQVVNSGNDFLSYDSSNQWASKVYTQAGGQPGVTADDTLMNGYLDDGGNNDPYVEFDLKYNGESGANGIASYTVVLYANADGVDEQMGRYWVEDVDTNLPITSLVGIQSGDYLPGGPYVSAGAYVQTLSPANVDAPVGNYIVFEGITASRIRVRGAGNDDPEDFGRAPINGLQVIGRSDLIVPGDVNGDGEVLLSDYLVIRNNFRQPVTSRSSGDLNSDGVVSFFDFLEWRSNATPAALAQYAALIPEPTAGLICLLGCLGLNRRVVR
ncbi:MAG: dockerin type I domain-containing protein [Lacipirellulaceae bacterium]